MGSAELVELLAMNGSNLDIQDGNKRTAAHLYAEYDLPGVNLYTKANTTAMSISYPIGFFDNLSIFTTYSWEANAPSFFLNYQHDYRLITAYFMAYYTPSATLNVGNEESDFVGNFTGPGLRVMLVFKH